MPIIDVTAGPRVTDTDIARLAQLLPDAVAVAIECPEEPYDGRLQPGDAELRFRSTGPHDVTGLDIVVEIRSKWFASRAESRQDRCDRVLRAVAEEMGALTVGVYLSLPVAAWSQTE
ncbi:hypothetical protein GCM10027062_45480 [Nocardioides hungaricus]